MNLFQSAVRKKNTARPPVWFMRQAGRYHSHYQRLRREHSFMDLCKIPELACEVTFGPLEEFGFDAAILFSDLLFPLEALGMGLSYDPSPKLAWHLESAADLADLRSGGASLAVELEFQAAAIRKIRAGLSPDKGLIGFVGGPLTLYYYAAVGTHQLKSAAILDARYDGFCEKLIDLLAENMKLQAHAGADAIAVFDTAAGEISAVEYRERAVPALSAVLKRFRAMCPETPVIYYSKNTDSTYWEPLRDLPIDVLGVDWHSDLPRVIERFGDRFAVQGNIDPSWLLLSREELEPKLREWFGRMRDLPSRAREGWICGLGHGVLQGTPEENVRLAIRLEKEILA